MSIRHGHPNTPWGFLKRPFTPNGEVKFQKLVLRVSSGFPNMRKQMKARGRRPSAFIVFECLETPMKHEARVFEIASQSKLKLRCRKRNKIVKTYAN